MLRARHLLAAACALLLGLLALAAVAVPAQAAKRAVPHEWLGVNIDGPMTHPFNPYLDGEYDLMAKDGVESTRAAVFWRELQPYASFYDIPAAERPDYVAAGGRPTDWSTLDAIMTATSKRYLRVVPVLQGTPPWAAQDPSDPASSPRGTRDFTRFATALVKRYGPHGDFWRAHPDLPAVNVRSWQIWNEPNLTRYWSDQPFAKPYVALLRAANKAIKHADPHADVILAGLPNESFKELAKIYHAHGRLWFDAIALHPYTGRPSNVLKLVRYARREARRFHDPRKPVWITELSWPASKGKLKRSVKGFETTESGQASRLRSALRLLARHREDERIGRVYWYTWLSSEQPPNAFEWSGLRRLRDGRPVSVRARSVFRTEARKLEGCRKRPGDARHCR